MAKSRKKMRWYDWVLSFLIAVGLLNWGLVGWFEFDLVEWLSFGYTWIATALYTVIAVLGAVAFVRLIMLALKR